MILLKDVDAARDQTTALETIFPLRFERLLRLVLG